MVKSKFYYIRCRICKHVWSTTEDEDIALKMKEWVKEKPLDTCENCGTLHYPYVVMTPEGGFTF